MKKLGFAALLPMLGICLAACNGKTTYECSPIFVFDTTVSIVFYNQPDYKEHYNKIKQEFNEISRVANDYQSYSGISVYDLNLNRSAENEILADMMKKANDLILDTNGYFNPYIGRLSRIWKDVVDNKNLKESDLPSSDTITSEIGIMNNTSITIDGNKVTLNGSGNVDLGAFTKGYALEWAVNYLNDNDIKQYYINCGNSSVYVGNKELNVNISKPFSSGNITSFKASNIGVGTSSPQYQKNEFNGVRYHHLISPKTGYPSNYFDSVNIISNNNLLNDVYSTAVFSMDLETAESFADEKNFNLILYKDGKIIYQRNDL